MVFQLKPRNVSKEDKRELYKKYKKIFKKKLKQDELNDVLCSLFLDIIYIYFNNKKRKLYKLFFPAIMANFIEMGSINSVIKEYRTKNKLYSESYTCRILKTLDENDGLEISKIFRKILFKLLKQNGLKNKLKKQNGNGDKK